MAQAVPTVVMRTTAVQVNIADANLRSRSAIYWPPFGCDCHQDEPFLFAVRAAADLTRRWRNLMNWSQTGEKGLTARAHWCTVGKARAPGQWSKGSLAD